MERSRADVGPRHLLFPGVWRPSTLAEASPAPPESYAYGMSSRKRVLISCFCSPLSSRASGRGASKGETEKDGYIYLYTSEIQTTMARGDGLWIPPQKEQVARVRSDMSVHLTIQAGPALAAQMAARAAI